MVTCETTKYRERLVFNENMWEKDLFEFLHAKLVEAEQWNAKYHKQEVRITNKHRMKWMCCKAMDRGDHSHDYWEITSDCQFIKESDNMYVMECQGEMYEIKEIFVQFTK